MSRLSAASVPLPQRAAKWPAYRPQDHGAGIVHLGIGNFARAHLLSYTDDALAAHGGDWRVVGASLRGSPLAGLLEPQDYRYTLVERGVETKASVIGALHSVVSGGERIPNVLTLMASPACRIVSLTVTEKGYGLTGTGKLDTSHPDIARDLGRPQSPQGVIGLIVAALALRQQKGLPAFTVLSCDNLPQNGRRLREAVLELAALVHDPSLVRFIEAHAAFPSGVVDRITPIPGQEVFELARAETGYDDLAAIETEPFRQWILEDSFCVGRPAWEAAGALFVPDITDYERMKLWMLNGTHSLIAYCGCLYEKKYVRDVMADGRLKDLVARHLSAASSAIGQLGIDLDAYVGKLKARFSNPAIAHATAQIAMDGTQKLPQRITAPAFAALKRGTDFEPFAFAIAVWIAYVERWAKGLAAYEVSDPQSAVLREALSKPSSEMDLLRAASAACPHVLPAELLDGKFGAALLRHIGTVRA
ncbi:mannitol dehydrogenase family protein [Rhizobium lusitanum]|uniref:Fructuronate reductase n=1 Tax=Rhizobium lusitanum TaxID=293958 RepID=A0A7X0IQ41_9HYPH|nr:mannitol dehydrogenase family protein [Rhizobium lusitanum]MBB6484784.1 fructuronate reductase [Rhizobium lusitanum]